MSTTYKSQEEKDAAVAAATTALEEATAGEIVADESADTKTEGGEGSEAL